ncbi:hypothetical protein GTZ99_14480 [Novosphingobium sp. FSY-8]|uniref:Uncharacterized protein n=1 Tax=Novosphingobium ovatum TaxID=1908523 RepID=A0ABW9XH20_9SPHN|nr:hypothetical protein [Novosphingobium ovatum]NBC37759.1 hypothetical protein [Novosphingobium ovatum]
MSIFSKSTDYDEASEAERQPRKRWTIKKILLAVLGGYMVLGLFSMIHDRLHTQEADAATYPVAPAASARDDALAFHRQIAQVTMQCEFASGSLNVVMMSNDPVAIYQGAKAVDADCIGMSRKLDGLVIPQTLGREVAQAYAAALKQCKSAYLDRWSMAHSLEAALDSGGKVSALADLRRDMRDWKSSNKACEAAVQSAPAPLGITEADLFTALGNGTGPNGSVASTTPDLGFEGQPSPAIRALIHKHLSYSADCQTGEGEPNACALRDQTAGQLHSVGWCYGRPTDVGSDSRWHSC